MSERGWRGDELRGLVGRMRESGNEVAAQTLEGFMEGVKGERRVPARDKPKQKKHERRPRSLEWPQVGFVSIYQLAHAMGCSHNHVYNLVKRGELPSPRCASPRRMRSALP